MELVPSPRGCGSSDTQRVANQPRSWEDAEACRPVTGIRVAPFACYAARGCNVENVGFSTAANCASEACARQAERQTTAQADQAAAQDRKSTRLNSSHLVISY